MRRFLAVVGVVGLVLVAAAQAASQTRVTLTVTGYTVLFGHQLTVAGHVTNGRAGQQVILYARQYGMPTGKPLVTLVTGQGGTFRYLAHPTIQTSYTAVAGGLRSRTLTVGVRPIVHATELGNGQIVATVAIGRNMAGHLIKLQQQLGAAWQTVAQRPLDRSATATFASLPSDATLRMAFSVNEAGKGYLGALTNVLGYKAYRLTLMPTSLAIHYGRSVTLGGHLVNGQPGQPIELFAQPYGSSSPIHLGTVMTTTGGFWNTHVTPRILTLYQATWSGTEQSPRVPVNVMPTITVRELANGTVSAHVQAGKSLVGRSVRLQHLTVNGWQTVAKRPLDRFANATFAPITINDAKLRVAFSVNQAGKGYLGSFSRVLNYHTT